MAVTRIRITAEEYFVATEGVPRTQLIDGEIVVNEPNLRHVRIGDFLLRRLANWCDEVPGRGEAGSPADVRLNEDNVYAPDVWWVSEARRLPRDALRFEGVPELVVEVLSASTRRFDLGLKWAGYESAGASELWIVDPRTDSIVVHRRSTPDAATFDVVEEFAASADDCLRSALMEGLAIEVARVFDR